MTIELFRRSRIFFNNEDKINKFDINNFINDKFNYVRVYLHKIINKDDNLFLNANYSKKFQKIARYFITLIKFNNLNRKQYKKFTR